MTILIMTDLEGISLVDTIDMIPEENTELHAFACRRLMADLNAAVEGAKEAGADTIYVVDGHGGANSFIKELLHPDAVQLTGNVWEDIIRGGCDAYLEIGCHAKPGTLNGFLDHVQNSRRWYDYRVNGLSGGETLQGALFAGAYGVPFVALSGDEAVCREAKALLGDIPTAVVKKGIGRNRAECLPAEQAEKLIREAVREGILCRGEFAPFQMSMPLELELDFYRSDYCDEACACIKNITRINARRIRRVVEKIETYGDVVFG